MGEKLRLHLGGLGSNVQASDLHKTFTSPKLGEVQSVEIIRTKGRSFAYIEFVPASDKGLSKLFSTVSLFLSLPFSFTVSVHFMLNYYICVGNVMYFMPRLNLPDFVLGLNFFYVGIKIGGGRATVWISKGELALCISNVKCN
ncbi:hypothetical protein SASPL_153674 [Salvia splendens]|uniref:RRM domain-containing protein n=1 Tax=Salvia splendens TaxID=180675 RepID=A0A8X8VYR4_SALSN|nr:hypothetical protein SASPL_153674 [Salvia splendens]